MLALDRRHRSVSTRAPQGENTTNPTMPFIAPNPDHYVGRKLGSGQCVALAQRAAQAPSTGTWMQGANVMRSAQGAIAKGTVIATMVDGQYPNHASGNHVALYLSHDATGIQVLDQWLGQPVHYRTIHPHGGNGNPSNDADAFYVVE